MFQAKRVLAIVLPSSGCCLIGWQRKKIHTCSMVGEHYFQVKLMGHDTIILYVEDNPANLRLVELLLKSRGDCEFIGVNTPAAALELVTANLPDLILLDINLPGMNGFDVLKKLRDNADTKGIPVVAVSANAMSQDIDKALKAGFDDYISKPIDVARFQELVSQYLQA